MEEAQDPIAAVTHPDPYPYYAGLVRDRPFHRDAALRCWVAAGGAAVRAVLTSARCRVRPRDEPVPTALLGGPAGELFGDFVRMNDGPRHAAMKQAVMQALASIDEGRLEAAGRRAARDAWQRLQPPEDIARLDQYLFAVPVQTMAQLTGVAAETQVVGDLVRGIAHAGDPAARERAHAAASALRSTCAARLAQGSSPLLDELQQASARAGCGEPGVVVANAVGFLFQAHDATAALIGNTLLALARHPEVLCAVREGRISMRAVVREVLRYDAPVQNTRRYVGEEGIVAGREIAAGDMILVLLAAANRDPEDWENAHCFDAGRPQRSPLTFGDGVHACPAERLAPVIAGAAVEQAIAGGLDPARLTGPVSYRPSINARIPTWRATGAQT
jgi:cytochrome P450